MMVVVGGATRLTDSGLSITEWKPIIGVIPPFSETHWLSEFEKYQQIPEYSQVNYGMSLEEFKLIYWWEWGHRFLGRIIGIAFFVPFVFFALTKQINARLGWKLLGLFFLGAAQGFLGWYMVKSGLSERVDVSQYRLAAHLGLAVLLFVMMAFLALELRTAKNPTAQNLDNAVILPRLDRLIAWGLFIGVYVQIILGAFVAGLRAGFTYNSWPLMDGKFFPAGYFSDPARFTDLFETVAAVQFNHRLGAYILFAVSLWFLLRVRSTGLVREAAWFFWAISLQAILGIATLIMHVPLGFGLAHQAGAMIVLFFAILLVRRIIVVGH